MSYKAEYIWVDGQKPTAKLRSKGKVIADGEEPGNDLVGGLPQGRFGDGSRANDVAEAYRR